MKRGVVLVPEWDGVSPSVNPGMVMFQGTVRIGLWCLMSVPGVVHPKSRFLKWGVVGPRCRSICRALMVWSCRSGSPESVARGVIQGIQSSTRALSRMDPDGLPAAPAELVVYTALGAG